MAINLILLTHRRGALICISKNNFSELTEEFLFEKYDIFAVHKKIIYEHYEYFFDDSKSTICARVLAKTAENLSHIFDFCCKNLLIESSQIENVFIGIGPGSFTGLRLGCAFINGMKLAQKFEIYPVKTFLVSEVLQKFESLRDNISPQTKQVFPPHKKSEELKSLFLKEISDFNSTDDSSGFIAFADLFLSLQQIKSKTLNPIEYALPAYGKEPTPVLIMNKGKIT